MSIAVIDRTGYTDPRVYEDKEGEGWAGLCLHHTGSASENGDAYWLSTWHPNPCSVHKLFGRKGQITKIVPEHKVAWHAGYSHWAGRDNCNAWMLGYEICNKGDGEPYPAAQFEAVCLSVAYDCALYHIPDDMVTSHRRVRNAWVDAHPIQARLWRVTKDKSDPLGWDWVAMWARIDAIRANWPAEFGAVKEWHDIGTGGRVSIT